MSKRRKGYPSETRVKRGPRTIRGGEVELVERLGDNDLCHVARRSASRTAAAIAAAFDGAERAHYERKR